MLPAPAPTSHQQLTGRAPSRPSVDRPHLPLGELPSCSYASSGESRISAQHHRIGIPPGTRPRQCSAGRRSPRGLPLLSRPTSSSSTVTPARPHPLSPQQTPRPRTASAVRLSTSTRRSELHGGICRARPAARPGDHLDVLGRPPHPAAHASDTDDTCGITRTPSAPSRRYQRRAHSEEHRIPDWPARTPGRPACSSSNPGIARQHRRRHVTFVAPAPPASPSCRVLRSAPRPPPRPPGRPADSPAHPSAPIPTTVTTSSTVSTGRAPSDTMPETESRVPRNQLILVRPATVNRVIRESELGPCLCTDSGANPGKDAHELPLLGHRRPHDLRLLSC